MLKGMNNHTSYCVVTVRSEWRSQACRSAAPAAGESVCGCRPDNCSLCRRCLDGGKACLCQQQIIGPMVRFAAVCSCCS